MKMMMMMNCFCGMVNQRKVFSLISSWDHCQRSSPSRISDTPQAGFEPAQNLSSGLVEWSCAVVITTTPWRYCCLFTVAYLLHCCLVPQLFIFSKVFFLSNKQLIQIKIRAIQQANAPLLLHSSLSCFEQIVPIWLNF